MTTSSTQSPSPVGAAGAACPSSCTCCIALRAHIHADISTQCPRACLCACLQRRVCAYMQTRARTHIHTHMAMPASMRMFTPTSTRMSTSTVCTHMSTHLQAHTYVYAHVSTYFSTLAMLNPHKTEIRTYFSRLAHRRAHVYHAAQIQRRPVCPAVVFCRDDRNHHIVHILAISRAWE